MEHFEEIAVPVSPTGQYFNSSILCISILAVLETEVPITVDDAQALSLLKDVLLPINPRFSSIMVEDKKGKKRWKSVEVLLEDHIKFPIFPGGLSPESYDKYFDEYMSKLALERLPQNKPLWEVHMVKYPTSKAAGNVIFKLHHALGDGYSLMGALLSCLQRADNPSLPLTFPSRRRSSSNSNINREKTSIFSYVPQIYSSIVNTISDVNRSILKSRSLEDDQTPIRSGNEGIEFLPTSIESMTFSLDQIKSIKTKLGVTINDVIAGTIFYGARLYMREITQDSTMDDSNSTALLLLNTRMIGEYKSVKEMTKVETEMTWGNRFTFLHLPIPKLITGVSNPVDFVLYSQKLVERKRRSLAVFLTGSLLEIMKKLRGPDEVARHIHSTLRNASMTISNMIGPMEQVALANHPIKGIYYMVVGAPQGLDISVVSYMGNLRVSFGVEKGHVDPIKLKSCMENAFELILEATDKYTTKDKLN